VNDTVLAIDIGSTKISAVIANINEGKVQVMGHGVADAQGIKKGIITNIEQASKSIKNALNDAKRVSGANMTTAIVSISNAYAKSISSNGIVNLPNHEISLKEINRVMQTALYNAKIPEEYEVIHVLPYNFTVDEQNFVEDPYGMNASRLEVDVNIIMSQKSNLSNLKRAVRSAGVEIDGIVLSGYASSISVLEPEDKARGVAVIDLGGQTSNLVVHVGNSIRYNDFLGVGSNHVTNDLSIALHTPLHIAEVVKLDYANLLGYEDEIIQLPIIGDEENTNDVSLEVVYNVVFARVEETLMILAQSLEKSNLTEHIKAGIILTGGMSKIKGIKELAQSIFNGMPVRVAVPTNVDGISEDLKDSAFSAVIGLLRYRAGEHTPYEIDFKQQLLHTKDEYKESLSDIQLTSDTQDSKLSGNDVKIELANEYKVSRESENITFDDLDELEGDDNGVIKKFSNWAKQLF
jgi:cell division protein FtsA